MAKRFVTAREQFELLSPWRIAMPEEDYDELYHLTDNPEFSGLDPHHAPSTISEEEAPGIYLTNDPHSHVGTNLDKPYIATFRVPAGYEDHPAFEPDHYGKSGDYFVSPEWYDHIQFAGVSTNPAHKKGGSDRTAAIHDQLMQIVAMADTTPWHPLIKDNSYYGESERSDRPRDRSYVVGNPDPKALGHGQAVARLEVTIHNKGSRQWKSNEEGFGGGYVPREHNEAYINSIIVHPAFQGQGIAQALIERLNKDYPEHKINPGVTTPKGYGLVQRLKKIVPGAEEKMSPDYKHFVMDEEESAEYESSEYANVGHEDYDENDYTSEYNPRSRQLVNASYDDGPYWGAGWDDEDDDDEDDWPEGTVPKGRKHSNDLAGKSGKLPEGITFSNGKMFDGRDAVQAHIGDKLVGQLQWDSRNPKRGFTNDINYITVHPEYRRRGIGSAMYQHAVQNIDPHLLPGSLDVTPSGRGLSKSLGFKPKDQGTYYDGTPMKFSLSPVRDDGNDWPDAAVGNGWQWDEKFNRRSKDRFSRLLLAMAWEEWAPQIKTLGPSKEGTRLGIYYIPHNDNKSDDSQVAFSVRPDNTVFIHGLVTNYNFRNQGVAESLIRRIHQDFPNHKIEPGKMTVNGRGFHDRMLEKEPAAKDVVAARFWHTAFRTAMPAPAPEGLRFQPGTPRSHGLGRTDAYIGDDPVGHLEWLDDGNPWSIVTKRKPGEVSHIYVHPDSRRQSVATEMFDWTKNNVRPDLHHSERRTDLGDSWVNYEQNRVASQRFWNALEPADYSVTVSGDWDGSRGQQGYDEDIYNLEPGAEVKVHGLKIKSWGKDWVDLGGDNTVVRHATAPVLDKPADFPDDWFEKHWGDDDDAPLPVPEQTGPPPRPADKILNEWVKARDSITPENLSDWHAAPWTNPLEQTLYKEFMHDWWPGSEAAMVRNPENVGTGWSFHPDEPITHWLNVEDFLNERYPEAATGGKYGLESAAPMLQRKVDDQMLSPEKLEEYGYIGHGNAITQAMLNLHNKLQGRKWDRPQDQKRYYELMLRHIGPNGKKVSRLAKLIEAMAWDEWAPKIKNTGVGTWACPEGGGCAHKEGSRSSYKVYHEGSNDPYPSYLNYSHYHTWVDDIDMNVKEPVLGINMLYVNANHRKDGVAEAMMRRLVEDHPGARVVPGDMSEQGQAFHDRMIEKEPTARELVTPDGVVVHLSRNIVAQANRLLLAMAWDHWAPKIKGGCDNGCIYSRQGTDGRYTIPQAGAFLDYYHYNHLGQDQVAISGIYTHPSNRGDGVAEAMMRRLSEDHPGVPIDPGAMTRDGQGFHDRMLEKEPTARELVTAAHEVMRHANYLESPEGRAHLEQLMQMQQQQEKFRNGPHDNWYHVSPHDLPEGTKLVPGGVGNSATSQDFYDMGFGDDSGNLKDMGAGRTQHVWLTPDLDDAHFWSAALNAPHIYEVDPHETPSPWNGTGTDGFVSPGATIRKKVSGG